MTDTNTSMFILATIIALIVLIGVIAFLFGMGIYNKLIANRNAIKNAFADIDVQLQRRYDLIPNLIATAKKYMAHESETLEAVTRARSTASSAEQSTSANPTEPGAMKRLIAAESGLSGALGRLFAVSEAYPDLKADSQMAYLSGELSNTENKVSFARQGYNDAVLHYNNAREVFPASVVANFCKFEPATSYELENAKARSAPKVEF